MGLVQVAVAAESRAWVFTLMRPDSHVAAAVNREVPVVTHISLAATFGVDQLAAI